MRILWISQCPWVNSGYGKITRNITQRLAEKGHEIYIFCDTHFGAPVKITDNITVIGKTSWTHRDLYDIRDIKHWEDIIKPHITITCTNIWVTETERLTTPWIPYTPLDADLDEHTPEITAKLNHAPNLKAVIAQSRYVEQQIRKVLNKPVPITTIPPGVDTEIYTPPRDIEEQKKIRRQLGLDPEAFYYITVAANVDRKDIPTLLKAFSILIHDELRDAHDLYLILWTNTEKVTGISYDIHRLCRRYRIQHRVYLPPTPHPTTVTGEQQLAQLYRASNFFVTTTKGEAAMLPLIEAMATGLPAVAPAHTALHEHLTDETPPPDPTRLPYKTKITKRGILVRPTGKKPELWDPAQQEYYTVNPQDYAEALRLAYNLTDTPQIRKNCTQYARQLDIKHTATQIHNFLTQLT